MQLLNISLLPLSSYGSCSPPAATDQLETMSRCPHVPGEGLSRGKGDEKQREEQPSSRMAAAAQEELGSGSKAVGQMLPVTSRLSLTWSHAGKLGRAGCVHSPPPTPPTHPLSALRSKWEPP